MLQISIHFSLSVPRTFNLHQVWAFPHTAMIAVLCTERALVSPVFQVVRRIDVHLLTGSKNHVPLL